MKKAQVSTLFLLLYFEIMQQAHAQFSGGSSIGTNTGQDRPIVAIFQWLFGFLSPNVILLIGGFVLAGWFIYMIKTGELGIWGIAIRLIGVAGLTALGSLASMAFQNSGSA